MGWAQQRLWVKSWKRNQVQTARKTEKSTIGLERQLKMIFDSKKKDKNSTYKMITEREKRRKKI